MSHSQIAFTVIGLIASIGLGSSAALAQSGDNRDPLSRASSGDTGGLLQMLHGIQNGQIRNENEFSRQQGQQINNSTQSFRAEQLRRIRAQQQQQQSRPPQ